MAIDLRQQLERVNAKTTLVLEKYALMQERLAQARAEIESLRQQLVQQQRKVEELELQRQYLMLSHTVAPGADDTRRALDMIDGLVRDIDRCIADIAEG
ncbi:MAG: hypothetical protein J6J61_09120 [Muribaculaceae bacterium]|nr:hypothetical protein [Muribaculaceae bacterium]MBP3639277.1 hypothetical protein [Muribaculaceae bacterium]